VDTASLLLARRMAIPPTGDILDLGCGYGVLGLIAAKLAPGAHVTLVDVNERATRLAAENAAANSTTNVEVLTGDAPEVLGERSFDAILCNPPIRAGKQEVHRLLADAAERLRPGGALWLVIRTRQGAKSRIRDIGPLFSRIETISRQRGCRIYRCDK
jgi:16S rRNA (guanine1207-N2)-methyltransferase